MGLLHVERPGADGRADERRDDERDELEHKLRQLQSESRYEVRARARNAGGWGEWTAPLALETTGLPPAGQCVQDEVPCDDRGGEVLEIDFLSPQP